MTDVQRVEALRQLRGTLRVPGDKSGSHRAVMISALADGESTITGISSGGDVRATLDIIQALGATVTEEKSVIYVSGPREGLRNTASSLECANSGTTMRLMSGIVAAVPGQHELVGDASLSQRPMDRVAIPLRLMGAEVKGRGPRLYPPLAVKGRDGLLGVDYEVPETSAQVKSAVLLAGLAAISPTTVTELVRTRTTTEDMLRSAGVIVTSLDRERGRQITVTPGRPRHHDWVIPGDPSQAAFFAVLGAIHPDASLEILSLDGGPERTGFVNVLQRMGADVSLSGDNGDYTLRTRSSHLEGTEIWAAEVPSVDEVPVLMVAACAASGISAFRDMGELRLKESDRFEGSQQLARSLGCKTWSEGDDFFVEGLGGSGRFSDFTLNAGLDHRMVMSAAVAATAGSGATIVGASTVSSSYPRFFSDLGLLA